eukprot:TRINITY_DN16745_c0_g1_i1.p1 TRINITY_DN16745_c0_g1~~TRINITY_DN16745_c0_g1_i1.p1  ORF type:complete len:414 (-),score=117.12 TRINITY_DN16745_c0_g1_i1:247-1488(-)
MDSVLGQQDQNQHSDQQNPHQHNLSEPTLHPHAHTQHNVNNKNDADFQLVIITAIAQLLEEKITPIYDILDHQREQIDRLENLLTSIVAIRYPELKRKGGILNPNPVHNPPTPSTPPVIVNLTTINTTTTTSTTPSTELVRLEDEEDEDTPTKKRRRIYSHDISNKINTMLEPLFEENWKITKEKEREIGEKLSKEIGVEIAEALTIVKSFWHRSRGNSKRLFTQLDDYREGLLFLQQMDPIKRSEAMRRFRIESEEIVAHDLIEINSHLEAMRKKGSSRTAVKGPKPLRPTPETCPKTTKGRAASLCNHFFQMVHNGYETLPPLDEPQMIPEQHDLSQLSQQQPPTQLIPLDHTHMHTPQTAMHNTLHNAPHLSHLSAAAHTHTHQIPINLSQQQYNEQQNMPSLASNPSAL